MSTKASKRVEVIVQSILGCVIIAVLSFFTAVQLGAFDQTAQMAKYAQPLTGDDVVEMLTSNSNSLRQNYANYDKMLARAKERGSKAFFANKVEEQVEN